VLGFPNRKVETVAAVSG